MRWPLWRVAVTEQSMEPTLLPGDWLLVRRSVQAGRPIRIHPGQLVVTRHPERPAMLLVKRAARWERGGWWLVSDSNSAGAVDSRRFGPAAPDLVEGRVLWRYRPLRRAAGSVRR
jgi:nickel-type superoxide dismutase maturation protease